MSAFAGATACTYRFPFHAPPVLRLPADSLLPGRTPTHEASLSALPKTLMPVPGLHQQHGGAHDIDAGDGAEQSQHISLFLQPIQKPIIKPRHARSKLFNMPHQFEQRVDVSIVIDLASIRP